MLELLSVVVPCYNEEEVILETHQRLSVELERISAEFDIAYEIVYVNDGSRDATLRLLHDCHSNHGSQYPSGRGTVSVVSFARNFGHQMALSAGLQQAHGDAIAVMDADLQDPPATIGDMVREWRAGSDVVYGVRSSREGESRFKLVTAAAFYRLMRTMAGVELPADAGDFRLMSRRAVDVFNAMPERHRFVRGMIPWLGFRQSPVYYARAARLRGTTKYPLRRMIKLAFDAVTSFSTVPLKITFALGIVLALTAIGYLGWVLFERLYLGTPVRGWSSLMAVVLVLGAVQLVSIGVLGEYVGRIFEEVKRRPLYIVDERASRIAALPPAKIESSGDMRSGHQP